MAKSWKEKFASKTTPLIKTLDKRFADIEEGEKMLIATPGLIDQYIRNIPAGSETDLKTMRKDLALDQLADKTCPVTTGIYLRIVIEKAYEEWQNGAKLQDITPFWRVLNKKAPVLKKLSFPYDFIAEQRAREDLPI